ncbi:MAG: MFS transporter [Burkholderiaceae bacterium]|nr:MAG: MFS transporter [Burkholderiaceae bacterium]TAL99958.1 MAG: MFS transporter [Pusillimonas sp.]
MKFLNRWWVVVGSVFGLLVGNGPIMQFTFGVFLLPLGKEFGWSRSSTSLALAIGLTVTAIFVPIAGRLVDRYGIRVVTLASITLFSLALASVAFFATTLTSFIIIYAIMGIGAAGQTPLPYAKAVSTWFDEKRGLALGVAMSGVGVGVALVPKYAQSVMDQFGWRGAYLGLAILTFVVGVLAVLLASKEPSHHSVKQSAEDIPGLTARQAFRTATFWKLAIAFVAVVFAMNGALVHVVPMLIGRGVSADIAASSMAFAGVALIAGRLLAGYMLDRVFAPYVASVLFAIPLVGLIILFATTTSGYASVAVVLIGLGLGAEVDLIAFLLSRYLGLKSFGEIYGYLFASFMIGNAVGPYVMSLSFDMTGSYHVGLAILGVALLVGSATVLSLGEYRYPQVKRQGS